MTAPAKNPRITLSSADVPAQADLLLNYINEASRGRDLSGILSDVIAVCVVVKWVAGDSSILLNLCPKLVQ